MIEPGPPIHDPPDEIQAIRDRYARREAISEARLYDPLNAYVTLSRQERERAMIRCLRWAGLAPVESRRAMEIGCGTGTNLLDLIRLGFSPENLVGNDLLPARLAQARARLPRGVSLLEGDAATLDMGSASFDLVLQSTVFTSILHDDFQARLAARMWSLVRPGGGVLWYDFVRDNPLNPDVRGVPVRRIRRLFPEGTLRLWPVTLAPPIGRRLCRIAPALYHVVNSVPLLRTHVVCWIQK